MKTGKREKYWIKYGRENNWPLINKANGGKSSKGFKHTENAKIK